MDITQTLPEPRALPTEPHQHGRLFADALPRASFGDMLGVMLDIVLPTISKGVIIRRPRVLALAERFDLDRRGVRRMQLLRARHGTRPLVLRFPRRSQALIFDPADVHRVLENTPDPFSPASSEKRAALSHFEPRGALISSGTDRTVRRQLNEQVLQSADPVHQLAERFADVVDEEARALLDRVAARGALTWDEFSPSWFRLVRRVVFGDAASEDHDITETMAQLRRNANWAFLWPQDTRLREHLLQRIRAYLRQGEPGSLAAVVAARQRSAQAAPEHQVPQWLFAFDPAGMATFRALALLATHPEQADQARHEARSGDPHHKPLLRATVLESLRLWPTTPVVLRQTTSVTSWGGASLPAGTGVLLYAPFFHRDSETQPFADRFEPGLWLTQRTTNDWPLMPFSSGPAVCPARHLVLMLTSALLARLVQGHSLFLLHPSAMRPGALPASLNHFGLRFELRPRHAALGPGTTR